VDFKPKNKIQQQLPSKKWARDSKTVTNKNKVHCGTKEFRACWRLTKTSARPSDARIATATSHFIGVFFDCAWCLEISRTLEDPH